LQKTVKVRLDDMRLSGIDRLDGGGINIDAKNIESRIRKDRCCWQANVS